MGFRPTLPDSLPMIGEIDNTVFLLVLVTNISMTSGPKTGYILAQLVTDNKPNLDISGYSQNASDNTLKFNRTRVGPQ